MAQFVCRYRKGEELRWISHLDLKRTLERAMRRAGLPLALSQGHNPHPRLSLGPPLPLGATSDAELLTLHLSHAMEPEEVKRRLNQQLPPGLEVLEVWLLPSYRKKETLGDLELAGYEVRVGGDIDPEDLRRRVDQLLASDELLVHRGGERPERTVNLRPFIRSVEVAEKAGQLVLRMQLRTGSHGGARPQEVAMLLGLDEGRHGLRYHRTHLSALPTEQKPQPGLLKRWRRQQGPKSERNP